MSLPTHIPLIFTLIALLPWISELRINRIAQQALIRAADQFHPRGKNYRQILDCTIGVVFLGTPFRGSWEFGYTTADVRVSAAIATETEFTRELIEYL